MTEAADLAPRTPSTAAFSERWTYHILLDDGVQLILNYSVARLSGLREPTCGADLSVLGFGGRSYHVAREYAASADLSWDARRSRLLCRDKYFEGLPPRHHRVYFQTRKEDISYLVDLTFSDIESGMTWGDGIFHLGRERIGMFIHIPYARVSGTLMVDGVERRVVGTAYMDHTYQTTYAPRLVRSAFRLVSHHRSGMEVGFFLLPQSRYGEQPVGFGLRRDAGVTRLLRPDRLEVIHTRQQSGVDAPRQIRITYDDGSDTLFTRRTDRQAFSALEDLSRVERLLVRQLIGGDVVLLRGMGMFGNGQPGGYDFLIMR